MSLTLSSPAFAPYSPIDSRYTCEGEDVSPPLVWSGIPDDARSLALVLDDPDAPGSGWVHWLLYNLPPQLTGLPEAVNAVELPERALEGLNDWRRTGYGGPCPPSGRHRYFFTLYALDCVLPDLGRPTKNRLERAMDGHLLAKGELMGTYSRGSAG
ncbi:MAG: YbhB/YbcL family Raf kinase inhibitor-like protein [Gammaproteobacteria bacterium]|nr:YbhB/YbcL family Raf kinase inhibitor-like protein [Gammaproteobacteria bacterium]